MMFDQMNLYCIGHSKAYGKAPSVKIMQSVEGFTDDHHLDLRITGQGIRIRSAQPSKVEQPNRDSDSVA